jgi:hypothetical protein
MTRYAIVRFPVTIETVEREAKESQRSMHELVMRIEVHPEASHQDIAEMLQDKLSDIVDTHKTYEE